MLLTGPSKPDRSSGEGPDEACIPVLHTRGLGSGLTTRHCEKFTVTETNQQQTKKKQVFCMAGKLSKAMLCRESSGRQQSTFSLCSLFSLYLCSGSVSVSKASVPKLRTMFCFVPSKSISGFVVAVVVVAAAAAAAAAAVVVLSVCLFV